MNEHIPEDGVNPLSRLPQGQLEEMIVEYLRRALRTQPVPEGGHLFTSDGVPISEGDDGEPLFDDQVGFFIDLEEGTLSHKDREVMIRHLADCPICRTGICEATRKGLLKFPTVEDDENAED